MRVWSQCPFPTGAGYGASPEKKYFEFSSKNCRILYIFIAKNYLWPETRTWGLIDPLGAEDIKRTGVENLRKGAQLAPKWYESISNWFNEAVKDVNNQNWIEAGMIILFWERLLDNS